MDDYQELLQGKQTPHKRLKFLWRELSDGLTHIFFYVVVLSIIYNHVFFELSNYTPHFGFILTAFNCNSDSNYNCEVIPSNYNGLYFEVYDVAQTMCSILDVQVNASAVLVSKFPNDTCTRDIPVNLGLIILGMLNDYGVIAVLVAMMLYFIGSILSILSSFINNKILRLGRIFFKIGSVSILFAAIVIELIIGSTMTIPPLLFGDHIFILIFLLIILFISLVDKFYEIKNVKSNTTKYGSMGGI